MKSKILVILALLCFWGAFGLAFAGEKQTARPNAPSSNQTRVNLNTASAEQLAELPGIGEKVAARIVAYRGENGGFRKVEEIMNVKGIGEKLFTRLRDRIFVEPQPEQKKK